ncbi:MAG: prepilin peptidase [Hyphomicrobiaceae bacterium]
MALAGSMDLFTMTIPNRISIVLVAGFVVVAPFVGMSIEEFAMHVAAGSAVLALCFLMFARGWIGGGDAKVFAAASLWMGFDYLGVFTAYAAMGGGILTFVLLFFRLLPLPAFMAREAWLARLHHRQTGVPYGIAIAASALFVYPMTPYMQAAIEAAAIG